MSASDELVANLLFLFRETANPSSAEIRKMAIASAHLVKADEQEVEIAIKKTESKLAIIMSEGVSLIDVHSEHDPEWSEQQVDSINWKYWEDYKKLLATKTLSPNVINMMGNITLNILGQLQDPALNSSWDRRGLVIGHVQSGKTANYTGLICRAADAGYKFIIVIAGIHNSLRNQTQCRIDECFVGRDSTPGKREIIGVGLRSEDREFPISLTTTEGDFTQNVANQFNSELRGFKYPVIVVIKKNVTTLKNLHKWLKELNTRSEESKISDIPMLMIDDEADHASINTGKPEEDPTKTNEWIRRILSLFSKKCYVGYTATPFANIFINPESKEEMMEDDLFPRDFIYCLNAPTNYLGPDKVFLDFEGKSDQIVRTIEDAEPYIPLSHKKFFALKDLPSSLKQSINTFLLAQAIKKSRIGDGKAHCSMMIHASRFVNVQRQISSLVADYVDDVKNAIKQNYQLGNRQRIHDEYISALKTCFETEYADISDVSWPNILESVVKTINSVQTVTVNNKDDRLEFKRYEDKNTRMTVIAVGGLSLSRGLTIEGLLVSYMYRNTKTYDTLMQMGRWFGYRDDYEDLCRIWLSSESKGWYSYIAEVIEDLRDQINDMRQNDCTPIDFALSVRTHPEALKITAPDKMRNTDKITRTVNLSGKLVESHIISSEEKKIESNSKAVISLLTKLQEGHQGKSDQGRGMIWGDISWEYVSDFLFEFEFHKELKEDQVAARDFLEEISEDYPKVDVAFITPKKSNADITSIIEMEKWLSVCQKRTVGVKGTKIDVAEMTSAPTERGYHVSSRQRVGSRGCEVIGLTDEQKKQVEEAHKKEHGDRKNISDREYRKVREKPLLLIHILSLNDGREKRDETLIESIPAIGISFPCTNFTSGVEVVVNKGVVVRDRGVEE